jgi:hypothetical protein
VANEGGLVVQLGIDDAKLTTGLKKAGESAKQAGQEMARNYSDGYRLAIEKVSAVENTPFGARGVGWGAGMAGYNLAGPNGPEAMAAKIATAWSAKAVPLPASMGASSSATAAAMNGVQKALALGTGGAGMGIGGGLGRGIAQTAFAAQDFAAVLDGGGKNALSRALMATMNNVQMLGAAFGPWGMAITAVGGALGAILIPSLLKGVDETEKFTESLKANADALKTQITTAREAIEFSAKAEELRTATPEMAEREKKSLEKDLKSLRAEKHYTEGDYAANIEKAMKMGAVTNLDPAKRGIFNDLGLVNDHVKFSINEDVLGKEASDLIAKQAARLKEVGAAITKTEGRIFEVDTIAKGDATRFKEDKDLSAEMRKRSGEAQRIRDTGTPLLAAQAKIRDITDLVRGGYLEADVAEKASREILGGFARSRTATNLAVSGGDFGSASGFSDVLKSIRQSQGTTDPQLDVLKESKKSLDQLIALFRAGLKLSPPIASEGM